MFIVHLWVYSLCCWNWRIELVLNLTNALHLLLNRVEEISCGITYVGVGGGRKGERDDGWVPLKREILQCCRIILSIYPYFVQSFWSWPERALCTYILSNILLVVESLITACLIKKMIISKNGGICKIELVFRRFSQSLSNQNPKDKQFSKERKKEVIKSIFGWKADSNSNGESYL